MLKDELVWGRWWVLPPYSSHLVSTRWPGLGVSSGTSELWMDVRDPFQPKMPQGCDSECELLILRVPWFQHGLLLTLTESIDSLQTPMFFVYHLLIHLEKINSDSLVINSLMINQSHTARSRPDGFLITSQSNMLANTCNYGGLRNAGFLVR